MMCRNPRVQQVAHPMFGLCAALAIGVCSGAAVLTLSCAPRDDAAVVTAQTPGGPTSAADSSDPPALVVDMSAPLLLEEPVAAGAGTSGAKNQACLVCHGNYTSEKLAAKHAKADITCVKCHGESIEHKNDENNTTPPEAMFARDAIEAFCRRCHEAHEIKAEMIRKAVEKGAIKMGDGEPVCTDCHGEHRMKVRTVIWDKKTGQLLQTNRGE